jgi:hypothetical protein
MMTTTTTVMLEHYTVYLCEILLRSTIERVMFADMEAQLSFAIVSLILPFYFASHFAKYEPDYYHSFPLFNATAVSVAAATAKAV